MAAQSYNSHLVLHIPSRSGDSFAIHVKAVLSAIA